MTETFKNGRYCPCKGCPDRYPACSDHCRKDAFLKWKEEQALIRKNRQAYNTPVWDRDEADKSKYRKYQRKR